MPGESPPIPVEQMQALGLALVAMAESLREGSVMPEGLAPADAARFLGISRTKLHEMNTRGLVPEPVDVGGCPRFSRSELRAWLLAGTPTRSRWMQMREVALRRVA